MFVCGMVVLLCRLQNITIFFCCFVVAVACFSVSSVKQLEEKKNVKIELNSRLNLRIKY